MDSRREIERTVGAMLDLVRRSSDDPSVGAAVAWLKRRTGNKPEAYVGGAWRLLGAVPYEYDPPTVELIRSPDQFLTRLGSLAGDCDDQTVLLGALLHHAAAPTRPDRLALATVSTRPDRLPHHVFLVWKNLALDPIMSNGTTRQVHPATASRWPGWWVGLEKPITNLELSEV